MMPILTALPGEHRGYVSVPSGQLHYREQGQGIPLLLAHQAPWSSIQYHRVLPLLAENGFRAIAVDLPGHGMSSPPDQPPTIENYALSMVAVMDALEIDQAVVAGHHGGALIAGRMAAAFPGRVLRLAMDNAPLYSAEQRAERLRARKEDVQVIDPAGRHFTDRWTAVRQNADPAWSDVTVHMAVAVYFMNGPWREHAFAASVQYDFAADVPRISCPTLVLASRADPLYPCGRRLVEARPDWTYGEFSGGAGMVFERPEEWVTAVAGFLAA